MSQIKVESLKIARFRRFKDINIPFGERVTLITGQNGTSKSTLLGMLAQPFSFGVIRGKTAKSPDESKYLKNYHGMKLHEYEDLTGKPFMYDCDDVFRLSRKYDFGKDYQYETKLLFPNELDVKLPDNSLLTKSRDRTKNGQLSGMRFVTGPGTSHESGEGNFPHPVLYLGLNRLWPPALTQKCMFSEHELSIEDKKWYIDKYNYILCIDERDNKAKFMDTREKRRFITPESNNYDGESCSAGQDNLSQILTAILSFRGLKRELKDRYQGGILLIDELDATLHAFAQSKILEILCEVSHELGLQVVTTSHSLRLLEMAYQSKLKSDIHLLHLANKDGSIVIENFSNYQEVCDHLRVEVTLSKEIHRKVSVVFEDDEGKNLFHQICGSKLRNFIACANTDSLGSGQLKNLANMSKSLPALKDIIFIPDGDMANTWNNPPENMLALPGGKRPETLIYQHLYSMNESDPFWTDCGRSYTKQYAILSCGGLSLEIGDDKKWVKKWYTDQCKYWGKGKKNAYKSWIQAHKEECREFCLKFLKVLKVKYKYEIKKDVIESVLLQLKSS